jgi:hypothetical protein
MLTLPLNRLSAAAIIALWIVRAAFLIWLL